MPITRWTRSNQNHAAKASHNGPSPHHLEHAWRLSQGFGVLLLFLPRIRSLSCARILPHIPPSAMAETSLCSLRLRRPPRKL